MKPVNSKCTTARPQETVTRIMSNTAVMIDGMCIRVVMTAFYFYLPCIIAYCIQTKTLVDVFIF